jgi:hypothetical protein
MDVQLLLTLFEYYHRIATRLFRVIPENTVGGIAQFKTITRLHFKDFFAFMKTQFAL